MRHVGRRLQIVHAQSTDAVLLVDRSLGTDSVSNSRRDPVATVGLLGGHVGPWGLYAPRGVLGDAPAHVVDALLFMALMLSSSALLAWPVLPPGERGLPGQGRPLRRA